MYHWGQGKVFQGEGREDTDWGDQDSSVGVEGTKLVYKDSLLYNQVIFIYFIL